MTLAETQRALAELIRTGRSSSEDPYVATVRQSTGLHVLRDCIAEWRELVLRRACPLTAARLRSRGTFEAAVRRVLERECPAFLQDLALAFLEDVAKEEPELKGIAEFEAKMIVECAS